jgi:hypothetical protein
VYFVAPSEVRSLGITSADSTALSVAWDTPSQPNGNIRKYRVSYRVCLSCIYAFPGTLILSVDFTLFSDCFTTVRLKSYSFLQFNTNEKFVFDASVTLR